MRVLTRGICRRLGVRTRLRSGAHSATRNIAQNIRTRSAVDGLFEHLTDGRPGVFCLMVTQKIEDLGVYDAVPQGAAGGEVSKARCDLGAELFQQVEKDGVLGTDFALQPFLDPNRDGGGPAVGGDGKREFALAMDGAKTEAAVRRIVDGVAQHTLLLGHAEDF